MAEFLVATPPPLLRVALRRPSKNKPNHPQTTHSITMTGPDPDFPMDRVLTDETRKRIMGAYRRLLSASDGTKDVEVADGLPRDVDVLLLQRFDDNSIHAQVLLDHGDGPTLVTDDVEDCPNHTEGDQLSTLADLGKDYAELEMDLLEVSALMCDLPEFEDELEQYAIDRVAFQNLYCVDGLLTFT